MYYTFIVGLLDMLVMPFLFNVFFNESVAKIFFFMTMTIYLNLHLSDAFIQSNLQCIQAIHFYCQYVCSLGIEPTTFALLTQCSNH